MRIKYLFIILHFLPLFIFAQSGQVGEWVDYSPYHSVFSIAEGNGVVYGATNSGLIEFTKSDNSFLRFSKVEGLSDVGVKSLGYNPISESFFVGYFNGKIDLISKNEITTVPDLFNKTLSGNKSLNSVYMKDQFAYVSTGFGIVKFDMEREEFSETYLIGDDGEYLEVNSVTIFNDTIYAATVSGVRKAWVNDPQLTYYKAWQMEDLLPFPYRNYDLISSNSDRVFVNLPGEQILSDSLFVKDTIGGWNVVPELSGLLINSINSYETDVVISHDDYVANYNENWEETYRVYNYGNDEYIRTVYSMWGEDSVLWIGDNVFGLIENPKPFKFNIIAPESPKNSDVDGISILNDEVWIAAGARKTNWNNTYNNNGVYWRSKDLKWGTVSKFNDTLLKDVFDIIDVIQSPFETDLTYGASLGGGLIEFDKHTTLNVFNESNSGLKEAVDFPGWCGVTGFDFDSFGNLWMLNSRNPNAVAVYTYDKKWLSYSFGSTFSQDVSGAMVVGQNNYKWGVYPLGGKGVLLFDDAGTLEDTSDDQFRILNANAGSGGLPSNNIFCIAEDLDGKIWVGTAEGIGVFYSPNNMFDEDYNSDAQQIIVEVDGYFQYLLGTETVTAIAIDGANRKWLGTSNSGVFLMSADGTNELYHFTKENSPLLDNNIKTIEVNHTTGEVLFGTINGVIAFKGTATGSEVTTNDTYAYPNPVPIHYDGLIAIKGLASNSSVRITDITGNLVFETIAEGTQAVWNGSDMNGERVGTGVYLVFGIDTEGKDSQVAKIMFTR